MKNMSQLVAVEEENAVKEVLALSINKELKHIFSVNHEKEAKWCRRRTTTQKAVPVGSPTVSGALFTD